MKSERAKVLHRIAGRPMIEYSVALARALGSERIVCVLGHQATQVKQAIEDRFGAGVVEIALQAEQRGTGHALLQAAPLLQNFAGELLITCGDVPLLTVETLQRLRTAANDKTLAMLTMVPPSPNGYGRILRDASQRVVRVVEEKDCSDAERAITEVNSGVYLGPSKFIFQSLGSMTSNNAQNELYLTHVIERAAKELTVHTENTTPDEVMGINDRVQLGRADALMRLRLAEALMRSGVTVRDPGSLCTEPGIVVGQDCELGPGVELRGKTTIGKHCHIEAGCIITDSTIGNGVHIKPYCVLSESTVGDNAQIGPWAHLRPGSTLEEGVHLGNFVETKKTRIGRGSKANHLSYLGDADIGEKVNVGCGTITCNYDGRHKHKTIIEDGVFIGSDTQLVAPVTVGKNAVVGAGTTVTKNVPPGALALTRPAQVNVEGYAERKRK